MKQFIAAIAGSAGSHASILEFFDHTPHDDVSFVVLRHLPMTFKSELTQILTRHSSLHVQEIKAGTPVRPDTIYLAPPGKYVMVKHNIFSVAPRTGRGDHSADIFMASLAGNSGRRAIGVILPGILDDGSEGVRSIRQSNGLTLAQDPTTAPFAGMPENAIRTGCIDYVARTGDMPNIIHRYVAKVMAEPPAD